MAFSAPSIPAFPSGLPTKDLLRVSFAGLRIGNVADIEQLYKASTTDGFLLLDLTDSEQGRKYIATVDAMFKLQKEFFKLDLEKKKTYMGERFLGYKPEGASKGDLKGRPDRYEMWTTQKEDILGMGKRNPAPDIMSSNRDIHEAFVRGANAIKDLVLASLESSLQMQPGALTDMHRIDLETMDQYRMICYPPQPASDQRSSLAPHSDFGSMTMLFNMIGGLQFLPHGKNPEDETEWLYIKPDPGHAIINIGDVLLTFTNGALKSPMHRVVSPPGDQAVLTRYSLAYFARPEVRIIVRRLDGEKIPPLKEGEVEEGLEASDWFAAKIRAFTVKQ